MKGMHCHKPLIHTPYCTGSSACSSMIERASATQGVVLVLSVAKKAFDDRTRGVRRGGG